MALLSDAESAWRAAGLPLTDWLRPGVWRNKVYLKCPYERKYVGASTGSSSEERRSRMLPDAPPDSALVCAHKPSWEGDGYSGDSAGIAQLVAAGKAVVAGWPRDHPALAPRRPEPVRPKVPERVPPQLARLAAVKRELETVIDEAYVARGRFAAEAAFQATVSDTLIAAGFANSREQPVANTRFDIIVTGTNQHYPAGGQYHADMGPIVLELKLMGLKLTPAAAMKDKEQVLGYVQLQDGLVERTAGSRYVAAAAVVYAPKSGADGANGLAPAVKGETVVTWVYLGAKYRGG